MQDVKENKKLNNFRLKYNENSYDGDNIEIIIENQIRDISYLWTIGVLDGKLQLMILTKM